MKEENGRLRKIVIALSVTVFLLVAGFVAYLSYGLSKLNSVVADNTSDISVNSYNFKKLDEKADSIASQAKIPGAKGDMGDSGTDGLNGKDSISTKTTVVKQVPVNGKDGKDGSDGRDGREIEIRNNPITTKLEWRYTGETIWTIVGDGQ